MARRMTEAEILLDKQCQYIESLGFFIAHACGNKIRVCSDIGYRNEVTVYANSNNIILDICNEFHNTGIVKGQNQFRNNLLSMLNEEVY